MFVGSHRRSVILYGSHVCNCNRARLSCTSHSPHCRLCLSNTITHTHIYTVLLSLSFCSVFGSWWISCSDRCFGTRCRPFVPSLARSFKLTVHSCFDRLFCRRLPYGSSTWNGQVGSLGLADACKYRTMYYDYVLCYNYIRSLRYYLLTTRVLFDDLLTTFMYLTYVQFNVIISRIN